MDDDAQSVVKYYATCSTDELVYILSSKDLTSGAREALERELRKRGISDITARVDEVRSDEQAIRESERQRVSSINIRVNLAYWFGIGLCLSGLFNTLVGAPTTAGYLTIGVGLVVILITWRRKNIAALFHSSPLGRS